MKRTYIVIDEKLLEAGLKATGLRTRKSLIDYALRDLLRRKSLKKILQLKGKVEWEGSLLTMRKERVFK